MYELVLALHSWLRWAVVLFGLAFLVRALAVWKSSSRAELSRGDQRLGLVFTACYDLQVLLGLALYFGLSPLIEGALQSPGTMMKDSILRFWGVEHTSMMLLALVILHVGRVRAKKALSPGRKARVLALSTLACLALTLAAIPWPFLHVARPLFRAF